MVHDHITNLKRKGIPVEQTKSRKEVLKIIKKPSRGQLVQLQEKNRLRKK